jgi:cell division protein FtsW (lipid II flippase)
MTRIFRPVWAILTWLVVLMIPVQFYLAGRGAFAFHQAAASAREDAWAAHAIFGTLIGLVVLLALLTGLAARLPRRVLGLTGLLFVLMLVQMVLAGFGDNASTRWLAAAHPMNALFLTGTAIALVVRSRTYLPGFLGGRDHERQTRPVPPAADTMVTAS